MADDMTTEPGFDPEGSTAIETLARRFCPQYDSLTVMSAGRNVLVEMGEGQKAFILKARHAGTSDAGKIANEAAWISHLYQNGIRVPCLLRSGFGPLVECSTSGNVAFVGYCYEKMPLGSGRGKCWDDPRFIQDLGGTAGRMHTLAESFQLPDPGNMPGWDSPEWIRDPEGFFHPSQRAVVGTVLKLREQVSGLEQQKGTCGLVHDDLHAGNVFKVDERVVIIDFECLHVNRFVAEIASALLFRTWIGPEKEKPDVEARALDFLRNLLIGYANEHSLEDRWYELMPLYLKLREISLFATHPERDMAELEDNAFLNYVHESVADNRPFLKIDFREVQH